MTEVAETTPPAGAGRPPEPLRERRRRELRRHLSDVATGLFLQHGFDAVRVADVARACGVTEKTVFNHFRSKEALLADRWEPQTDALCRRLADPRADPLDAALAVLGDELDLLLRAAGGAGGEVDLAGVRAFGDLVVSTPALLAHHREALERLTTQAAAVLAARSGAGPDDPEPLVTALALAGLWHVHAAGLRRHLAAGTEAGEVLAGVRQDLARAAAKLRRGL